MISILMQSVYAPISVFNRRFDRKKLQASLTVVILATILNTVIAPLALFLAYRERYDIYLNIGNMLLGLIISIMTWLAACTLFWLFSKAFQKGVGFGQIAATWGLSFIPNVLCIILYSLLSVKPEIYNGSVLLAMIFSALFIMLLIWKSIYYFMMMRLVLDTTLREILVITAASALVFTALMLVGSRVGIQVPML